MDSIGLNGERRPASQTEYLEILSKEGINLLGPRGEVIKHDFVHVCIMCRCPELGCTHKDCDCTDLVLEARLIPQGGEF